VGELLLTVGERLDAVVRGGHDHLHRPIVSQAIQKPGLVMAGLWEYYHPERLQVFGKSEDEFLRQLAPGPAAEVVTRFCDGAVPALVMAYGLEPHPLLSAECGRRGIPILVTPQPTDRVVEILVRYLAMRLAPSVRAHGVLIDIYGLGVLILGESGIGKSESALELITRGHRLVADDSVEIREVDDQPVGNSPGLTRHLMEVRGLGIVNVVELFGVTAVLESKPVEQVVRLFRYEPGMSVDRLGGRHETEILGHRLPLIEIPVAPGRNLAVLLEMSARLQLLKGHGRDASRDLQAEINRLIGAQSDEPTP
jgi:HPr kinase/phosphorylase